MGPQFQVSSERLEKRELMEHIKKQIHAFVKNMVFPTSYSVTEMQKVTLRQKHGKCYNTNVYNESLHVRITSKLLSFCTTRLHYCQYPNLTLHVALTRLCNILRFLWL